MKQSKSRKFINTRSQKIETTIDGKFMVIFPGETIEVQGDDKISINGLIEI